MPSIGFKKNKNQTIKSAVSVELLGSHLGDKLDLNLRFRNICRLAANQLNALIQLKSYLNFNAKRVLINSCIISNFNYCPLVWIFFSAKSLNKIESLQKRVLPFLSNYYLISYEGLLEKVGKVKDNKSLLREQYKLNLETLDWNQVTFGAKGLWTKGLAS